MLSEMERLAYRTSSGANAAVFKFEEQKFAAILTTIQRNKILQISQTESNRNFCGARLRGFIFEDNQEITTNLIICREDAVHLWREACIDRGLSHIVLDTRRKCHETGAGILGQFDVVLLTANCIKSFAKTVSNPHGLKIDRIQNSADNGMLNEKYRYVRYALRIMPNLYRTGTIWQTMEKLNKVKEVLQQIDFKFLLEIFRGSLGQKKPLRALEVMQKTRGDTQISQNRDELCAQLSSMMELSPHLLKFTTYKMICVLQRVCEFLQNFDFAEVTRTTDPAEFFVFESAVWRGPIFQRTVVDESIDMGKYMVAGKMHWLLIHKHRNTGQIKMPWQDAFEELPVVEEDRMSQ